MSEQKTLFRGYGLPFPGVQIVAIAKRRTSAELEDHLTCYTWQVFFSEKPHAILISATI